MRSSATALRRSQFIASLATWHDTFDKPLVSQRYRCTRRRASWPLRVSWKLFPGDLKTETFPTHHCEVQSDLAILVLHNMTRRTNVGRRHRICQQLSLLPQPESYDSGVDAEVFWPKARTRLTRFHRTWV
jgi:hypothetical protein